jgi:hypothetical protein
MNLFLEDFRNSGRGSVKIRIQKVNVRPVVIRYKGGELMKKRSTGNDGMG